MDLAHRLDDVKQALRVTHSSDDALLVRLLDAAGEEYLEFANLVEESSDTELPDTAWQGVVVMVKAGYDASPTERATYRAAAETLWMPHRRGIGA